MCAKSLVRDCAAALAFATRLGKLIAIDDGAYSTEEGGRTDVDLGTAQCFQ